MTIIERSGTVRTVSTPGTAMDPTWSHNGRWLAFLVTPTASQSREASGLASLWVASSTTRSLQLIKTPRATVNAFEWSPKQPQTLAFSETMPAGSRSSLDIVDLSSFKTHSLLTAPFITGFQWSPSGHSLAVGTVTYKAHTQSRLVLVSELRHTTTTLLHNTSIGYIPASWSPKQNELLYWTDPYFSSSIAADGLELSGLNLTSHRSWALGTTLTYSNWIAWSPSGNRVAVVMGGSRTEWDSKRHVDLCQLATTRCSPVSLPSHLIGLDPSFSQDGDLIFTAAPGALPDQVAPPALGHVITPFGVRTVQAWYQSQTLWSLPRSSAKPVELIGNGAHSPTAIEHGLLYVQADSLWFRSSLATTPVLLQRSVGPSRPYRDTYYGYLDWTEQYSWHS
ncbi:MAG: hypothetical protein ACP5O0_07915 [Acidimicrobiales bacterium]